MDVSIDFKQIYNGSPDLCISIGPEGQVIECNDTLLNVLGYSREEVLSMKVPQFYHPSEIDKVKENLNSFFEMGNIIHTDFLLLKKDGSTLEVSLRFTAITDDNGNRLYSNAVWRDVSELKETQRALEESKLIIEQKNESILASINYAKRIQKAILPPAKMVNAYMKNSFILYKPKDVVAGDFYWMEKIEDTLLFAAADCTGHGVPGAMVSVVCNNALNRAVREFRLLNPGYILDKAREIVLQEFERSEDEVKDGMDIALCSIQDSFLSYSGAHNPLWLIRNGELRELEADRQPIGNFIKPTPFKTHQLELKKKDVIYIFSDGYVDQFGGPDGKKFKKKQLKKLLTSIHSKPMEEQKELLEARFEEWRGELSQIDDVCVIGYRY